MSNKLTCLRCQHHWRPRYPTPPKVCPVCKRPDWNIRHSNGRFTKLQQQVMDRKLAGISQKEMADRLKISATHLCDMEHGRRKRTKQFNQAYSFPKS